MTSNIDTLTNRSITAANTRLASCGVTCLNSSSVFQLGFSDGLKVLCSENPHERQAWERYSQCKQNKEILTLRDLELKNKNIQVKLKDQNILKTKIYQSIFKIHKSLNINIMRTKLKFLFLISGGFMTILIFTFTNCEKPCTTGYDSHHYPLCGDTIKIPYTGRDSLTFLRMTPSDTDTIVYIGQGKNYFNYKEYILHEGKSTCDEEFIYDGYVINFTSDKTQDNIIFKVQMFTSIDAELLVHYIDRKFWEILWIIDNPSFTKNIKSLSLYGMNYNNVTPFFPIKDFGGYDMSKFDSIYFNSPNGIIRISLDSCTTSLTLLK